MVLAAGLGTRLRPLTNERPKALVEVGGRTMLEITLTRLRRFGIRDVIVNAHHQANVLIDYLRRNSFGMNIAISREAVLLDTGGGLKKAAWFFQESDEPFLLHNVDVLSSVNLARMVEAHREQNALATLAMQTRPSLRQLLIDENLQLCGRRTKGYASDEIVRRSHELSPLAFAGIHVISPRIFERMTEDGAFSIITTYLRLASEGERIVAFRADEYYWRDLGTVDSLRGAEEDIRDGAVEVG
jgi:NDP-sugar pyrophosphorylase family protein